MGDEDDGTIEMFAWNIGSDALASGCSGDSTSSVDRNTQVYLAIEDLRLELQNKLGKTVPPLSVFVKIPRNRYLFQPLRSGRGDHKGYLLSYRQYNQDFYGHSHPAHAAVWLA